MSNDSFALYLFGVISIAVLLVGSYPYIALLMLAAGVFFGLCYELVVWFRDKTLPWRVGHKKKNK
jgi:hypothetical protein